MAQISIPGGSGAPPLVFTVTGTSTTNYAQSFASVLQSASAAGSLTVNVLSSGAAPHAPTGTVLNEILGPTMVDSYTLSAGGEYLLAIPGIATTVNGSAAGADTVLAGGNLTYVSEGYTVNANGSVTYVAGGGNDNVDFVSGANTFFGDGASGDTITGGAGADSIFTGAGSSTVFSGGGNTLIDLGDKGTNGDIAYLGDGHATVNANGVNDTVVAGTNGQVIFAGAGNVLVNIMDNPTSSGAAGDTITAGTGATTVFDSVGGSGIFGGSGSLTFVGEVGSTVAGHAFQAESIVAGSGTTAIFGASGNELNLFTTTTSGAVNVVAGLGNETLNGSGANSFNFFANDTDTSSSVLLDARGSTASDYFATGTGSESIYGGSGADVFALDTTGHGGNISIYNWNAADSVSVDASNQNNVSNGTVVGGNYTVKLSDDTTVTFVGISSLAGHII